MNQLKNDTSEINKSVKELSNNVINIAQLILNMTNDLEDLNQKHDAINRILKIT